MRFTYFKQLDVMDCGPTCLKMVDRYCVKTYNIPKLRDLIKLYNSGIVSPFFKKSLLNFTFDMRPSHSVFAL